MEKDTSSPLEEENTKKRHLTLTEDDSVVVSKKSSAKLPALVVENTNEASSVAECDVFVDFSGFQVKSILSNSADYKRIIVEGTVENQTAIVILDKKPFSEDILPELFSGNSKLKNTFQNDIYGSYDCVPSPEISGIKTTIVYPATQKHIEKYIYQPLLLIEETPEIYQKVTLPFLESNLFDLKWVFNILEHKKEVERIVFEDENTKTGFILLPDLKWDGLALENLYLVAIVHAKGIKSLRDLEGEHLPLLENILQKGSKAIEDKYGLKRCQLRIYVHYQPSYYHLHVHFTSLSFNAPGIHAEKSHILQTIISNIKCNPIHYQKAVLPFIVKKTDQLYMRLVDYGCDI